MKFLPISLALCGLATNAFGDQDVMTGVFYEKHVQDGYNYEFGGLQVSYEYINSFGPFYSLTHQNNTQKQFPFSRMEQQMGYIFGDSKLAYYPILGVSHESHIVRHTVEGNYGLFRMWAHFGFGLKCSLGAGWHLEYDFKYAVNIAHSIIFDHSEGFFGDHQPKINKWDQVLKLECNPWKQLRFNLSGYLHLDGNKQFHTRGLTLTTGWSF